MALPNINSYQTVFDEKAKVRVMDKPEIEWITAKEAAVIMGVTGANVRYLCKAGKVQCRKFANAWQVSKQDAEDYVRSRRNPEWLYKD